MTNNLLTEEQLRRLNMFSDDLSRMNSPDNEFIPLLNEMTSPKELYYLPWLLNWDDDLTEQAIDWILKSPLCDAGTALSIYWLNQPVDWVGQKLSEAYDEWEGRRISLHTSIEKRLKSMDFPSQVIRYNPKWDWGYWNDDGSEDNDIKNIPECMKLPTPGERLPDIRDLPWDNIK